MPRTKEDFEDYKVLHNFVYPDDRLKPWINESNYTNNYMTDWEVIMDALSTAESMYFGPTVQSLITEVGMKDGMGYCAITLLKKGVNCPFGETHVHKNKKLAVYSALISFVKWVNKNYQKM